MKRALVLGVVLGVLALSSATARAEPGKANGGGWFESVQVCDGEEITIFGHGGMWSAAYVEDGSHFILVSQKIIDLRDNSVLFDVRKQGHPNQGPYVTCTFQLPDDFFGFPASIEAEGFFQP